VKAIPKDTQITEIIGRNRLINELLAAGLEVAQPMRDRGVDLIAYLDVDDDIDRFVAFPIQLKVSGASRFSVDRKYDRFPNLILAYVWGIDGLSASETYALTQREAVAVAEVMGWTKTVSWERGAYSAIISVKLRGLLEPYKMTPTAWRAMLMAMI
jgi:hypothetical protein